MQIRDNYINIHASYEINEIKRVTRSTCIYTFNIIGICPWPNMPTTLHIYVPLHFLCTLFIDPTLLHQSVKKQQTATFIYQPTVIYVPATNMTPYCHTYASCTHYLMYINGRNKPIYMPNMNLLPLTM